MIKFLLSTIFLCFLQQTTQAQKRTNWENYPNKGILQYSVLLENSETDSNYKYAKFKPANFLTVDDIELNSLKIRYNVKADVMECKIGSQHSIINSPEKIKEININGEAYEYLQYQVKKVTTMGYLHKLSNARGIYAKYFLSPTKSKSGSDKLSSYYLYQDQDKLIKKVKSIQQLISLCYKDFAKEALEFKRDNQLNLKRVSDFKKLLSYLDNLHNDRVALR
ncbi:hypothetical protein [Labilibaculum sp.]|uniref:hypothetical protein n=1 Tax=Labilibaculum sp. TaxID=2060723 RepID=UPI003568EBCE